MKRIVFTCCILAASCSLALAQSATLTPAAHQEQKIAPKLLFSSKTNEFYANASRSKADAAQKAYNEAAGMMQTHIADNTKKLETTADKNAKAALSEVVKKEQSLYTEIKLLSVDLMTNKDAIKEKLTAFMQTL